MSDFFHVLSRGVDKRKIFLDNRDFFRFIHNLFEFNDEEWVNNALYRFKIKDIASPYIKQERRPRKLLVDIHAFCLMPNHYHLLLSPKQENSISRFMKKINMGYAKYFNERYARKGTLFEGRYKSIVVKTDSHFLHLPYYIHMNPLDLKFPEWRSRGIKNYRDAIKFLNSYRWSSHLDYIGKHNFPSVTRRDLLMDFFGNHSNYRDDIEHWLKNFDVSSIQELILE